MLFNKNKKLLSFLLNYSISDKFLISEKELLKNNDYINDKQELLNLLTNFTNENYFEIIYTDRHGEPYLCVQILQRGKNYLSNKKLFKRDLLSKLFLAVLSAIITFVLGKLLYAIFA